MRLNRNVLVDDRKERTSEKIVRCCEENRVQDPCTVVLRAYVDRRSIVRGIDINLNAPLVSKNLNLGPRLEMHPVVIETNADGDDGYDNNGSSDHDVEDYNDPDIDEVLDDIDNEGGDNDGNKLRNTDY
ncbi:hypothetical protein J1N35_014119 [Gossypium stocksii]|uniref:Uncharacterized protein n=1 Tax=Gossypium stocksii TaxID=47602 RepID=A0A9D3VUZ4_9ROSI|nr:hypothetical protein J1N35_014119 [Gossypium stocksii]